MERDAIKAALVRAQERWLDEQREKVPTGSWEIQFLSVPQLHSLLRTNCDHICADLLASWGIKCHHITSSCSAPPAKRVCREDFEVKWSLLSSRTTWITGYLRSFVSNASPSTRDVSMYVCDATNRIQVVLTEPDLDLLDQLILIQHWVFVPTDGDGNGHLEVHGQPILIQPVSQLRPSLSSVQDQLNQEFTTHDRPLYSREEPWSPIDTLRSEVHAIAITKGKASKKRKFHAVFGRVSCVSPIAWQRDDAGSHYFVEVDHVDRSCGTRSTVNVLLAGATALRWHGFISPGLVILITNLKKVFSQECEVFLLQGSFHLPGIKNEIPSTTQLFLWNESSTHQSFLDDANHDKEDDGYMSDPVSFEGDVEEVVWDECLVLRGEWRAIVLFFHYPTLDIFRYLRVGSRVRIQEAHIIRPSTSATSAVILGLCTRSFVAISSHVSEMASASQPLKPKSSRRSLKKWSVFGDFYRQPLHESIQLLELFQVLIQQFKFGSDVDDRASSSNLVYRCVRRRDAVCRVVGISAQTANQKALPSVTLARRFLTSHSCNPKDCPSVARKLTAELGCCKTISDARKQITEAAHNMLSRAKEDIQWPLHLSSDDLAIAPIVVCLEGNTDSLDLEICDLSGRIPCHVVGDVTPVIETGGCALYMLKRLNVIVECVDSLDGECDDVGTPTLVISVAVSSADLQRIPLCSGAEHWVAPEDEPLEKCDLIVFVTQVDSMDSSKRQPRKQERRIHGVALRVNDASGCATMDHVNAFRVELMMGSEVENWFVRKHQWYYLPKVRMARIFTVMEVNRAQTHSDSSVEVTCVKWLRLLSREVPLFDNIAAEALMEACHSLWTAATQSKEHSSMGMLHLNRQNVFLPITTSQPNETAAGHPTISSQDKCIMAVMQRVVSTASTETYRVRDLFQKSRWATEDEASDLHQVRLITLIGVIQEKTLSTKRQTTYQTRVIPGSKRRSLPDQQPSPSSPLVCRLKIRDLDSLEAISIRLSPDVFSHYGGLQTGVVMELTNAQVNIARGTFKSYVQWGHRTRLRIVSDLSPTKESSIYGQMLTTRLMSLYSSADLFDRTIRRFVVRVVHVSYVVLKRRCGGCRKPLELMKQRRMWTHGEATDGQSSSCQWKHFQQMSPLFNRRTYVSASMRCIIDDGSAQSELFLENAVVWEMLRCGKGQQRRFEDVLSQQVSVLSYYATRSAADTLFTTTTARETEYYHNEWRAFVQSVFTASRSLVVFAQRFYSPPKTSHQTSVLTFGKDLRVTIPAAPLAQLEALRVDDVHVRNELQRRLASIRPV